MPDHHNETLDSGEQLGNKQIDNETNLKSQEKDNKHFENLFVNPPKHKEAINHLKNIRGILPNLVGDESEISAYHWLGYNFLLMGQHKKSTECYNEVLKLAIEIGDKKKEISAYVGLGNAFSGMGNFESLAEKYFLEALSMMEQTDDNHEYVQKETHIKLANVYYTTGKFDAALDSYFKAQQISVDLDAIKDQTYPYCTQAREVSSGYSKEKDEANIWFMLGNTFQKLKQRVKAIESYQRAVDISKELKDEELQMLAEQRLAVCQTFASVCCEDPYPKEANSFLNKKTEIHAVKDNDSGICFYKGKRTK